MDGVAVAAADQDDGHDGRRDGQRDRRDLWQGFGDGLTQAFEMAVTPVLFALFGLFLDGRLGTRPVFTVALAVFAMVGAFLRAWYHYLARVEALEDGKVWRRR